MNAFVDWYRDFGIKRGNDPADPDNELHKVGIGTWLDPVLRCDDRIEAIKHNVADNKRACVAVWGPSQTGKSTLLSHYVDGLENDGSDSALTWDKRHPVRFSPPLDGASVLTPRTLVFNPYHFGSDASGVATRYTTIAPEDEAQVDPEFPVEIKLARPGQIIQSLSLGYLSECEPYDQQVTFTRESILHLIESNESASDGRNEIDVNAYLDLKTIADSMECMRNHTRFGNLFGRSNDWEKSIRPAIVSSKALCSSRQKAHEVLGKIFWDGAPQINGVYGKLRALLAKLQGEWGERKIKASYDFAALLLDIDSYKSYVKGDADKAEVRDKVSRVKCEIGVNDVRLSIADSPAAASPDLAGDNFGYLQALCGELVVPMRKEALERNDVFCRLCEKCDILDIPGLSNHFPGEGVAQQGVKINLNNATNADLLTRAMKEGKIQCFVYNYSHEYGIDAFLVLVRTGRHPSNTNTLDAGIIDWIRSYNKDWKQGENPGVPVFLNLTFFAKAVNDMGMAGPNPDIQAIIDMVRTQLTFSAKESSQWFATTYPQFPEGIILSPQSKDKVIQDILCNKSFVDATGFTRTQLEAVFGEDGGVNYMLECVDREIEKSVALRRSRCQDIVRDAIREIKRLSKQHLPTPSEESSSRLQNELRAISAKIERGILEIEQGERADTFQDLANELKAVFSAAKDVFDPIPANAKSKTLKELSEYVDRQVVNWYTSHLRETDDAGVLLKTEETSILEALRGTIRAEGQQRANGAVDKRSLVDFIRTRLGSLKTREERMAGRFPFAVAFCNILWCGRWERTSTIPLGKGDADLLDSLVQAQVNNDSSKEGSPYYHSVIKPLQARLDELQECAMSGMRKPQDGDDELGKVIGVLDAITIL